MPELRGLKVTFIAGTLGQGGAERQLFYLLKALVESGAQPNLLCLTTGEYWEPHIKGLGVPVIWIGQSANKLARLAQIIKVLRAEKPEILQSQHFYTNLYVACAARALNIREIGAMRNNGETEVQANGKLLGRLSLRAPRIIAANSRAALRYAAQMGVPAERLNFLPNVVCCKQFSPLTGFERRPLRLVFAGRLVKQKRLDRLLSVIAHLHLRRKKDIRAYLVGDGPLKSELESRAAALGLLPDVVTFSGAAGNMAAVYQQSDMAVLSSDWEGTPNVLLEAMASGLPVVATRVGGIPDIVRHGETGFLVEPGNEEAMVDALASLIDDADLRTRMGAQARRFVLENHSTERLPRFLNELYRITLN